MNRKIFGIFIVMLLITPIAIGSIEEQKEVTDNSNIKDANLNNWDYLYGIRATSSSHPSTYVDTFIGESDTASDYYVSGEDTDYTSSYGYDFYTIEGFWNVAVNYHLGPKENRPSWTGTYGYDIWTFRLRSDSTTQMTLNWDKNDLAGFNYNSYYLHINSAGIHVSMQDTESVSYTHNKDTYVKGTIEFVYLAPPYKPETPTGHPTRQTHEIGQYSTVTTDPSGLPVNYKFQWGDGTYSDWSNDIGPGERYYKTHSWSQPGTYTVRAQARNFHWVESDWSDGFQVTVTEEQTGEPPDPPEILAAPVVMIYGETYDFTAVTNDPDDDDVQYFFTWDFPDQSWEVLETEFIESGEPVTVEQSFESPGYTQFIWMDVGAVDTNGLASEFCEPINLELSDPPEQVFITGQTSGTAGKEYTYEIRGYDPNPSDIVSFEVDWGDGQTTNTDEVPVMQAVNVSHTWADQGNYVISVTVYDQCSIEGPTETLSVSMPKNKPYIKTPFVQFLENHPHLFPLLQKLLGLQ